MPAREAGLPDREPAIGLTIGDDSRAYPLRILMWHEIVNDLVGGVPVAVTFCPLCSTGIVFDGRLDGHVLTFGTILAGGPVSSFTEAAQAAAVPWRGAVRCAV